MKNKNLIFLCIATIVTPLLNEAKLPKNIPKADIIKSGTNISKCPIFLKPALYLEMRTEYGSYHGEKIVLYIYPSSGHYANQHKISPEDAAKYKDNNIVVWKRDCESKQDPQTPYSKFEQTYLFWKKTQKPWLCCSLIADNNKQIDIYTYKKFGCDMRFYVTSHPGRIAILIDEKGNIVSILDNVKNEKDVFESFGI